MFLLLILFGLLALGLAFVTYWQADVQGASRQEPHPPAASARKSAAPKSGDAGAAPPAPSAAGRHEEEESDHDANGQ